MFVANKMQCKLLPYVQEQKKLWHICSTIRNHSNVGNPINVSKQLHNISNIKINQLAYFTYGLTN